uniref:S-layer n=1 Tax=Viridibacillus arvi TaxID=263475 RepID=A0A0K2Z0V7_9BACL|nr:S-layer [Viridibacillus arvi]
MGKFNLKFVKPVASLAIGAAVLTGSFAVTGAADTAFAKAATVKVSKGKLVSAKSGKAVKGYKSYKGVLYKNGKKFTGLYKNTYYKSGKKGTGLYKNVYYKAGKKGSGWVGSGSSKKWYQDGKLLTGLGKNSGKLFIKGKYANGIQTYKGVEKLYKDGVVVKTVVDAAKAINNTTVEVTFAEAQKASDISAGRFAIEGLEVTNAVVKQTDAKVIVLTTAAQTGGKTYTVALDGVKSRTFKGVSNVLPTGVTSLTPSVQGVIGQQVTLSAKVSVATGESAAGIPVTFNVPATGSFNQPVLAESITDANGVATYTYTRYAAGTDNVTVYATGDRSKFSTANVYWANTAQLTVKDITEATTLVNGSNKVYEINSAKNAGGYVFVTFAENLDVTPDKVTKSVTAQGVSTYRLTADGVVTSTTETYPHEVSTGGKAVIAVKLNADGKANLVLSGSDASVTPIVFEGVKNSTTFGDARDYTASYSAKALQAKATTVKFELKHQLGLTVQAQGVQKAATWKTTGDSKGTGGRDFVATYTDKDGKAASEGTTVFVAIPKSGLKDTSVVNVLDANGDSALQAGSDTSYIYYSVTVGKEGKATFTVNSKNENDYIAPVTFIDNGTSTGAVSLDKNDLQAAGEITYFIDKVTYAAQLKATSNGKAITTLVADGKTSADFKYVLVDQNGKERTADENTSVSFSLSVGTGKVTVDGTTYTPGNYKVVTKSITAGTSSVSISVIGLEPSSATVTATASKAGIVLNTTEPASKTVTFTKYASAVLVTGEVSNVDLDKTTITISEDGKTFNYNYEEAIFKLHNNVVSQSKFESLLFGATVTASKDDKGVLTLNIIDEGVDALTNAKAVATTEINKVTNAQTAYTAAGGATTDAVYTDVTAAKNALQPLVTAGTDLAGIKSATTTLTTKLTALKDATDAKTATLADLNTAKTAVQNATYTLVTADTAATAKTAVEGVINNLPSVKGKFTATVTQTGFTAAAPATTPGEYKFTVKLVAADTQNVTTSEITVVIPK